MNNPITRELQFQKEKQNGGIERWKAEYDEAVRHLTAICTDRVDHICSRFTDNLAPYLQFVRIEALAPSDYPSHIDDNGVFLEFEIDLMSKKVILFRSGHLWITDADREKYPRCKYLAMRSMPEIAENDYGVAKFRKQGYKTAKQLAEKMSNYWTKVIDAAEKHSGPYPYDKR